MVGLGRLGAAVLRRCAEEGVAALILDSRRPGTWPAPGGAVLGPRDVVVDCSAPQATRAVLDLCAASGAALVECVSNLDADGSRGCADLAATRPVVLATNLSLGNYLQHQALLRVTDLLAALGVALPEATVLERHPTTKAHRPSATAAALGALWEGRTGQPPADVASLRAGAPVSEHGVRLTWAGQELHLAHDVRSLDAAAEGAVLLARWAAGRPPGLHPAHAAYDELARTGQGGNP